MKALFRQTLQASGLAFLLLSFFGLGLVLAMLLSSASGSRERSEHARRLKELLSRAAPRDVILAELGLGSNHVYYEKGTTNWQHLEAFMSGHRDIARQVGGSGRVIYSTTADVMTWIVLDDQSRITNYYLCSQ